MGPSARDRDDKFARHSTSINQDPVSMWVRAVAFTVAIATAPAGFALSAQPSGPNVSASVSHQAPLLEKKTIGELEQLMKQGDLHAQAELGARYGRGDGVQADVPKAIALLKDAAAKNNPDAQHWLATAYTNGVGVEKDEVQASLLYEKAAQQGHKEAQYIMGNMIAMGQSGFAQSWTGALPYFQKSADQRFPFAEYMMGFMHQMGYGVERNPETAAYWYRRTLSHSQNIRAQYNLAVLIGEGLVKPETGDPAARRELRDGDITATPGSGANE
jgi:uncharacterized protein